MDSDIIEFFNFSIRLIYEKSCDLFVGYKISVIYHSFNAVRLSFYIGMVPIYTFGGAKKSVLWFFILVHFHMKASWWVACGKNSRLAHFTLVKINIAFLVTLAMHLLTVSLLKLGHILSRSWRPSEKMISLVTVVIVRLSRISTTDIGKFGFIQHIVTKIQNYEKIKLRYAAFHYEVSMKHPTTNHEFWKKIRLIVKETI